LAQGSYDTYLSVYQTTRFKIPQRSYLVLCVLLFVVLCVLL